MVGIFYGRISSAYGSLLFTSLAQASSVSIGKIWIFSDFSEKAAFADAKEEGPAMLYYAKEMERTYIRIESTLLLAVTCYKMDRKEWKNLLQEAVSEAESYHFVRILTKEAGLWLPLLKKSREEIHWTDPHFHRQVLEEGKRMAQMYPGYLRTKAEGEVTLSDTARKILRMQAEGDSMNKIAGQLGLAEVTVKYHCRETYRKLGVNGKAAAVNEARKRKLI